MAKLVQGRIVYTKTAVADPQGQNPKEGRPFLVLSTNEAIKQGGPIYAVGITSTFDASQTELYVPLPYGPTAKTGLKRESAALCTWVVELAQDDMDIGTGYVHPSLVTQIAERVEKLKSK